MTAPSGNFHHVRGGTGERVGILISPQLGAPVRAGPVAAGRSHDAGREWVKALERESRELRQATEILRKASAYFAQAELDRPFKR